MPDPGLVSVNGRRASGWVESKRPSPGATRAKQCSRANGVGYETAMSTVTRSFHLRAC